jgi:hypothetical protein
VRLSTGGGILHAREEPFMSTQTYANTLGDVVFGGGDTRRLNVNKTHYTTKAATLLDFHIRFFMSFMNC